MIFTMHMTQEGHGRLLCLALVGVGSLFILWTGAAIRPADIPTIHDHSSHHRRLLYTTQEELQTFQPRITVVESYPATKIVGSLSNAAGTQWCQGLPTMWFVGHQHSNEQPFCMQPDGSWTRSNTTVLDTSDALNDSNATNEVVIDRHGCTSFDINYDNIPDIICVVGANKGKGTGYNEVYLTQPDGSVAKVLDPTLGLSIYPSMRSRIAVTVRGPNNKELLFIGVKGSAPRADGAYNAHAMFRNDYLVSNPDARPWFTVVQPKDTPWNVSSRAIMALPVDLTGNGVDDLIVCQVPLPPAIYLQAVDGTWSELALPVLRATELWQSVRVADVTGDGILDLVAVDQNSNANKIWVFKGQSMAPYFDFENPWFVKDILYAAPDVEILDVNGDGLADIYVAQLNSKSGYCSVKPNRIYWGGLQPNSTWVPPMDAARDLLFVGLASSTEREGRFQQVVMDFETPGCAFRRFKFGSPTRLILGNGDFDHAGNHLFAEWGV